MAGLFVWATNRLLDSYLIVLTCRIVGIVGRTGIIVARLVMLGRRYRGLLQAEGSGQGGRGAGDDGHGLGQAGGFLGLRRFRRCSPMALTVADTLFATADCIAGAMAVSGRAATPTAMTATVATASAVSATAPATATATATVFSVSGADNRIGIRYHHDRNHEYACRNGKECPDFHCCALLFSAYCLPEPGVSFESTPGETQPPVGRRAHPIDATPFSLHHPDGSFSRRISSRKRRISS